MSYATDGKCHNAQPGTYGHPARWWQAGAGWIIGTNSGTIIVVRFANDCWQYSMNGAGRSGASSVMGWKDLKSAIESARKHAEESFDGIAWQHAM